MDNEQIRKKFQNLNVWQNGDQRAVHKPLLVLYTIGKLLRGENRLISFADIEEDIRNLLSEFGPWSKTFRPQYPFWRLRNEEDEIWEIPDAHRIREGRRKSGKSTGDARIEDLRRYGVGGFLEPIAYKFQEDPNLAFEIVQDLLNAHFPMSYHEDILQAVDIERPLQTFDTKTRPSNFRINILRAYEYKCAVCGFDVKLGDSPVALEASHIKWQKAGGPDEAVNGMALCSLHHKLFDRGAFTLSKQRQILVSDDAHGTKGFQEWLMDFHGENINFPQRRSYYPDMEFIGWHVREVFKGDYREL